MTKPIAALLAGVLLGVLAGALKWRVSEVVVYRRTRIGIIFAHAAQMPPGGVVVIGDSIAERSRFDTLCGHPVLNAGVSWATSKDWTTDAAKVIALARPAVVILELGTDDHGDAWHADYRHLASMATFAVYPADSAKAAFERSAIRGVQGRFSMVDGKHPDQAGFVQLRAEMERGCGKFSSRS